MFTKLIRKLQLHLYKMKDSISTLQTAPHIVLESKGFVMFQLPKNVGGHKTEIHELEMFVDPHHM